MLRFDPQDPFPLHLPPQEPPYAESQLHAAEVDQWLGLETERIERELIGRKESMPALPEQQLWIGLPVQAMLTPYVELRTILARLAPLAGQTVVDLGAGYGRMGLVLARHHPGVRFVGYEYVAERVHEGRRIMERSPKGLSDSRIELLLANLADPGFTPISADAYFIYDYGTRVAIEKTLQDLRAIARTRLLTVIGRGRASRHAIEHDHPWLSQVREPEHHGHYSIYRTSSSATDLRCGPNPCSIF